MILTDKFAEWKYISLLYGITIISRAYSCTSNTALYKRVGDAVTLQFQARTTNSENSELVVTNAILSPNGSVLLTVLYKNGNHVLTGPCSGCTVTGDTATGDISIRLDNLQTADGGIYKNKVNQGDNELGCFTVYILGEPTKPAITADKDPSVGESVTLTCSSTSTAIPSISLIYNWNAPSDSRYTYSDNKETLKLSNVVKEDASKQFTCTATENVNEGYTSVSSDPFSPNVLYGPENLAFTPTNTAYEKEENTVLNDVTCTAVCNPPCTFKWTKIGQRSEISNTAVLSPGSLTSSEAGTYRCTATRSGGSPSTKDLTVNVIYGPDRSSTRLSPTTQTYTKNEGTVLPDITCSADCYPVCTYSWTKPRQGSPSVVKNNGILSLSSLTRDEAANYTCTANNPKRLNSPTSIQVEVIVRYGPENLAFTPTNTAYEKEENTVLNDVTCTAVCNPPCTFKWTKIGQRSEISNTAVLSPGSLTSSEAGTYRCTATRSGGSPSTKDLNVNVIYGPDRSSTRLSPTTQTYTKNEGTVLPDITCSADCYPDCTYTWTKLRQGSLSVVKNDGILSLSSLIRDEAAKYTCTAKNPKRLNSPTSIQVEVIVRYGPDSLNCNVQSPVIVTEGKMKQDITCSSDCYPGCSYSWKNDTDSTRSSSDGVLSLRTIIRYMAGSYTVTASNTATQFTQTAEETILVIVNYAPDVSTKLSSTDITEGTSLTLFCDGSGIPTTNYYVSLTHIWNNVLIPNNNTELPGTEPKSSVHFSQLQLQDTGTYTCTLNNGIQNTNGILNQVVSRNISVKVSPKVLTDELRFTGATDRMTQIRVPVYSFPDLETATFTRYDEKTITTDNKYNITIQPDAVRTMFYGTSVTLTGNMVGLTIRNLEENDFGNYTLKLTNKLYMTTVKVYVIAEGKPSPPKLFENLSGYNIPTFLWQKDFSGGPEQSFVIQTSVAGSGEWTNHTNINEHDLQYKINDTFYMANITGLSPGTYSARIFANNTEGDSELVYLGHTFKISEEEKEMSSSTMDPLAVGLSVSITIVVIVAVASAIFIWKRHQICDKCDRKFHNRNIDEPQPQYEDLKGATRSKPSQTYESLQRREEETSSYDTLSRTNENHIPRNDKIYENLKLQEM